ASRCRMLRTLRRRPSPRAQSRPDGRSPFSVMEARGSEVRARPARADAIMRWAFEAIERAHRVAALVVFAGVLSLGAVVGIGWIAGPGPVAHPLPPGQLG